MNITNPIYTAYSDRGYYCHITETGQWICDPSNGPILDQTMGTGLGIILTLFALMFVLIAWN
jgi:hypothetical protein